MLQKINEILSNIDGFFGGSAWFVFLLLGTGLFFTLYLGFPQIRFFGHALRIVRGKYDKKTDKGDASHFQALSTALSGTVGTGNIAGVALAIHLGGPAAIFWMVVTAFLGMTTKFVEVTLSHKYREVAKDGTISGGPMYYMKNKLNKRWLAVIFAVATIISSIGSGNMPQINSISNAVFSSFGIQHWVTGAVLSVLLAFVIMGGIKRIVKVTEKLVPTMAVIYFLGALSVIIYNYDNIIPSIISIFSDVFTGSAASGGFLGASIAFAFNRGVNRGLFSNEAGQGSAAIAHAAAKAHEPVSEGMVAILEPFIDTIIICSLTGLTLLSSGVWNEKFENTFQYADVLVLDKTYSENNSEDVEALSAYLSNKGDIGVFSGNLIVQNGVISNPLSLIHARSIAEDIKVYTEDETLFSGNIAVKQGRIVEKNTVIRGKSLLHSAPLTVMAFERGFLGSWAGYIVTIGLLLFAFSTVIAWSYYGGRSVTFLWGVKYVNIYRVLYILGFFLASVMDTTIIWIVSGIAIAFMTLPNLLGILMLRKDMKETLNAYWEDFNNLWGNQK